MNPHHFQAYSTGRFVDLTPLPSDVLAKRESFRAFLCGSLCLIAGGALAAASAAYVDTASRFLDANPFGLVWRIFL